MSGKKGMGRISKQEKAAIVRLRIDEDMSWPQVAAVMKRSVDAMRRAVGRVDRPGWRTYGPITEAEINLARMLYQSGASWTTVSAIVGRSANGLRKYCGVKRTSSEAALLRWQVNPPCPRSPQEYPITFPDSNT